MNQSIQFTKITFLFGLIWMSSYAIGCICVEEIQGGTKLWEMPCGTSHVDNHVNLGRMYEIALPGNWTKLIRGCIRRIVTELRIAELDLKLQHFEQIYTDVRSISDERYVLSWIPGIGDIESVIANIKHRNEVPKLLPKFYTDLQKFAVAFEHIIHDVATHHTEDQSKNVYKLTALNRTNALLPPLLCEIKSTLIDLEMSIPMTVVRSIMSEEERSLASNLQRDIRDYSIIKRYANYLKGWKIFLRRINVQKGRRKVKGIKFRHSIP